MERQVKEDKNENKIDLTFKANNTLIQAMINGDVFGKPKCMTRRRVRNGSKGSNRR